MGVDARILVKTFAEVTDDQILDWSWRLAEAFGLDIIWVHRPTEENSYSQRAIKRVTVHTQDGPAVYPLAGETFLEVSIVGRYYGPGYERGDIVSYIAIAFWLEQNIPDCKVWYGGDSSGVCLELFNFQKRTELMHHFCKVGHYPYYSYFGRQVGNKKKCNWCNKPMSQYGFSGDRIAAQCTGCGLRLRSKDNGKTWSEITEKET